MWVEVGNKIMCIAKKAVLQAVHTKIIHDCQNGHSKCRWLAVHLVANNQNSSKMKLIFFYSQFESTVAVAQ